MDATTGLWRRRFLVALVLVALTMGVSVAGGYWYVDSKLDKAETVELRFDRSRPTANFLVIGSDSREFVESEEDRESFGTVGGKRADTIIVVRVDPETRDALLVSFPRDLWVEVPGQGHTKINSAFLDGPQGVIDTLAHNFDIPIHHYVELDFAGFRNLVDAMGGVEIFVAARARDPQTGLDIPEAGCTTLDGEQALAWVRSRHFQYFESGRWHSDPTGDFGRIQRQQDFLRRLIAQSISSAATNPVRGNRLVDRALDNVVLDSDLGAGDVFKLVRVFRSADPDDVEMLTVPAVVGRRGSASVVLATDEAETVYERLRGDAPLDQAVTPETVTVRVLNGVGSPGLATRTAGQLREVGFLPGGIGDAETFGYETTEIRYRPGGEEQAELVRELIQGAGTLIEDESIGEADVLLIVGEDFDGVEGAGEESTDEATRTDAGGTSGGTSVHARAAEQVQGQDDAPDPTGSQSAPQC